MIVYNKLDMSFPQIRLFDSVVEKIGINNDSIIINFDNTGIWVKNSDTGKFSRTGNAQIELHHCCFDTLDIFLLRKIKISNRTYKIEENIDVFDLVEKINNKEWILEVVQEYFFDIGEMLVGRIINKNEKFDMYLKIEYEYMNAVF